MFNVAFFLMNESPPPPTLLPALPFSTYLFQCTLKDGSSWFAAANEHAQSFPTYLYISDHFTTSFFGQLIHHCFHGSSPIVQWTSNTWNPSKFCLPVAFHYYFQRFVHAIIFWFQLGPNFEMTFHSFHKRPSLLFRPQKRAATFGYLLNISTDHVIRFNLITIVQGFWPP